MIDQTVTLAKRRAWVEAAVEQLPEGPRDVVLAQFDNLSDELNALREAAKAFVDAEDDDAANDRRNEGTRYRWAQAYRNLRSVVLATLPHDAPHATESGATGEREGG